MTKEREFLKKLRYATHLESDFRKELEELLAQPEQAEQEPVAWVWEELEPHSGDWYGGCVDEGKPPENQYRRNIQPLYTTPPKRMPLSEDEIYNLMPKNQWQSFIELARNIEKAHGIGEDDE